MKTKSPRLKFEVKAEGEAYWWRCRHSNGEILFSSEVYTRKSTATKSMLNFLTAVTERDYEVEIDKKQGRRKSIPE